MRRTSIITTLFLVLVIIGLVVALVVTNLPPKQEVADPNNNEQVVGDENVGEEKEEPETPTYVALDSDIAKDMTKRLIPCVDGDFFYETKNGIISQNDLTDEEKMVIAYYYDRYNLVEDCTEEDNDYTYKIQKANLDKVMMKLFGNIEYTPKDIDSYFVRYEYKAEVQAFYAYVGGGGGIFPRSIAGTYKVEEYVDRYEVYQKYILIAPNHQIFDGNMSVGYVWDILNWHSYRSELLGKYKDFEKDGKATNVETLETLVSDVEAKTFVDSGSQYYSKEQMLLLSKYYDQATEYKHTFMKNEDGTFYWYKSEIIK